MSNQKKRDSILDTYMTAHAELLEIHVKSLEENQILRASQQTLIDQQAREIAKLNGLLNKLDSYIDFSEHLDNGDWGIENVSGINDVFDEIYFRRIET